MLNIMKRDRIRNETIKEKTGIKDIVDRVQIMREQWAGHLARMDNNKLAKKSTEWTPKGGRKLRRRWRDNSEEKCSTFWIRTVQDGREWMSVWRLPACSVMDS